MPLHIKFRRFGDSLSPSGAFYLATGLSTGPAASENVQQTIDPGYDPLAYLASGLTAGTSAVETGLYDAATGRLSPAQIAAQTAANNAAIAQAAPGNLDLQAQADAQALAEQNAVDAQQPSAFSNLLSDLGLVPGGAASGVAGAGGSLLTWIEANSLVLFLGVAAFLVFRPDKAFKRR